MNKIIWALAGLNTIVVVGYPCVLKCFEYAWFREWLISQQWLVDLLV